MIKGRISPAWPKKKLGGASLNTDPKKKPKKMLDKFFEEWY